MEVLRSAFMNNEENVVDSPALGGLYGSDGFFFQQRRGHLNLRNIASLNLEKLVREVDVDMLQLHIENITFCNLREEDLRYLTDPQIVKLFRISQLMLEYLLYSQDKLVENLNNYAQKYSDKKKSLAKKRRELVELEESTKLLRNQVKAKKQNIATLEDLLKEANRTREKELRKLKLHKGTSEPEPRPSIIKFFIAGPEGLCVEFVEKIETNISQLLKEARKAFISKRDNNVDYDQDMVDIRLVFKGKLLLAEQTLEDCDIHEGDTLMAMLVERKKPETPIIPPVQQVSLPVSTKDTEAFTREMFELIAKQNQEQMRDIVKDINSGWKTALETISVNSKPTVIENVRDSMDPQLLANMQDKWNKTELQLQEKLHEMQLKQAQSDQELSTLSVLAVRRRLRLGDLEDDESAEDKNRNRAAPLVAPDNSLLVGRVERVEHQTSYTSLDVERMRAELDELKRRLAEQASAAPSPVPVPEPVAIKSPPKELKTVPPAKDHITVRSNKWDHLPGAASTAKSAETPVARTSTESVVFEQETPVKVKQTEPEPIATVTTTPVVKEAKPKPPKPAPVVVAEPPPLEAVDLLFPAAFNPELAVLLFSKDDFKVTVSADIPLDDLLFELRKAASTKTRTKFAKVALEYQGKRVVLGMDMGEEAASFTAVHVRQLAASGELRYSILPGNPLTNAQIDMLIPSWEKNKVFTTASSALASSRDSGDGGYDLSTGNTGGGPKARLRKRRNWEDESPEVSATSGKAPARGKDEVEDDGFPAEPGTLAKGVYRQMRSSLDEALSEISDKEGLTDEELSRQIGRLKGVTGTLPKEVSDHLRSYKGSVAGALAAAASVDSGSDTAGGTPRGSSDMMRASGGSIASREIPGGVRRSLSMSLTPKDGVAGMMGGLLRLSHSSRPESPATGDQQSMLSSSAHLRRSVEQFDSEEDLNSMSMMDDTPMLASVTSSVDFRRQAQAPQPSFPVPKATLPKGSGIANNVSHPHHHHSQSDSAALLSASTSSAQGADSLMYSPSVSISASKSRYSVEDDDEENNSDLGESFRETRPQPKQTAVEKPIKPIKTRWNKAVDRSEEDDVPAAPEEPILRADAKHKRISESSSKVTDSVDSFKKEYLAGKSAAGNGRTGGNGGAGSKAEDSVADSNDRFKSTGDHTMMSSIPTLEDSMNSFSDQDSYLHGVHGFGSTKSTTGSHLTEDMMLSTTLDSEGEIPNMRGRDRTPGGVRAGGGAPQSASKATVEQFGVDDDASINSLALSDSNNMDD